MFVNVLAAAAIALSTLGAGAEQVATVEAVPAAHFETSCKPNDITGPGGWVCTSPGIEHGKECVIYISQTPNRALVVRDDSALCAAAELGEHQATAEVAKCDTDADCAAYSRSIGEEPSGYAAGK